MTAWNATTRTSDAPEGAPEPRAPDREPIVELPVGYRPGENETFMGPRQREYFRLQLLDWRGRILAGSSEAIAHLQENSAQEPDIADRASAESERFVELRTSERARKLLAKIDAALKRIDDGTYGYCEETGEPISLRRLEARPIATLSIEAQKRHEWREKVSRHD